MNESLLYIYGVVDEVPAELGRGLDDVPLRAIAVGPVAAIVGEREGAPEADEEGFWRHEEVVERLMEDAVVLPLRFGTTLRDDAAVEALLRSRGEEFAELLDEVRDAVELSVRAELPAPAVPTPMRGGATDTALDGAEYMRERGRLLRYRDRASEVLHESLTALSRRSLLLAG
ncbi:MAG TPA: GvpL/GvpF family gas vesicle protein, partial [Solirubrobacterales bacterium]|nr:GvpL/GvpF family gas vesicle protein [Solirubrobacterales bacterium]